MCVCERDRRKVGYCVIIKYQDAFLCVKTNKCHRLPHFMKFETVEPSRPPYNNSLAYHSPLSQRVAFVTKTRRHSDYKAIEGDSPTHLTSSSTRIHRQISRCYQWLVNLRCRSVRYTGADVHVPLRFHLSPLIVNRPNRPLVARGVHRVCYQCLSLSLFVITGPK